MDLTQRQQREFDYHRERALKNAALLEEPFSWEVLDNPGRRWWNAYWSMYHCLSRLDLKDKRVLVVGCGFGEDALRIAKMGARVSAFDLSPDSLAIARRLAERENLSISFEEMPAENLSYPPLHFDIVVARDILHHVDIPLAVSELLRVSKPGATFVINEIYSHSVTDRIRRSRFVENFLYRRMKHFVYASDSPYITEDERKLSEKDILMITSALQVSYTQHYNFLVTRLIPDRSTLMNKIDRAILKALSPFARFLAGRVLIVATRLR